jgi:hypothetical protein
MINVCIDGIYPREYFPMPVAPAIGSIVNKSPRYDRTSFEVEGHEWVQEEMPDEEGLQWVLILVPKLEYQCDHYT